MSNTQKMLQIGAIATTSRRSVMAGLIASLVPSSSRANDQLTPLTRPSLDEVLHAAEKQYTDPQKRPIVLNNTKNATRKVRLINQRTGENINIVYWANGRYIPEAIVEVSFFLRDWRYNEVSRVDTALIDILSTLSKMMDTEEPFLILSGYRTAKTNSILRANIEGLTISSFHNRAMAVDIRMKSRSMSNIFKASVAIGGGGVGVYGGANYTHLDSGPIRTWRA